MATYTKTNIDRGEVSKGIGTVEHDGLLTFAGAATYSAGTILAIDNVSDKFVAWDKGGSTNDNGTPRAVLLYDVTAAGAGDVAISAMVGGVVVRERLSETGGASLDASDFAALRANSGIVDEATTQLGDYDQ